MESVWDGQETGSARVTLRIADLLVTYNVQLTSEVLSVGSVGHAT